MRHRTALMYLLLLLLLLLSHFSRVRLYATPQTAAHQVLPSLGFSRQEYWSGWPFPSPMHESESEVALLCPTLRPHRWQPTRFCHPWDSPGKNTGVGWHYLLQWMKVKSESEVAQLCPTLCNPRDGSPPGSAIPGILQARALEWVAISFSNA